MAYLPHFRREMAKDGLILDDIQTVCRSGAVIMEPEYNLQFGQWRYRLEGRTIDGCRVAVVFAFERERAILITTWETKQ